ncbi:MAG TPA: hypothetical protein VNO30_38370 [Kofleriaceae bacterium]|nr:hypothetical protein [Kofleriaceae bacterium]
MPTTVAAPGHLDGRHIGEENIVNANLHVNGVHEVKMANGTYNATTRQCANTGCHGTETW